MSGGKASFPPNGAKTLKNLSSKSIHASLTNARCIVEKQLHYMRHEVAFLKFEQLRKLDRYMSFRAYVEIARLAKRSVVLFNTTNAIHLTY